MALFRFPNVSIDVDPTQKIAVRQADGKFYYITVQSIMDLALSGGLPSVTDDGTDVTVDANMAVTGTLNLSGLPTADPLADGEVWLDTGVLTISAGSPP